MNNLYDKHWLGILQRGRVRNALYMVEELNKYLDVDCLILFGKDNLVVESLTIKNLKILINNDKVLLDWNEKPRGYPEGSPALYVFEGSMADIEDLFNQFRVYEIVSKKKPLRKINVKEEMAEIRETYPLPTTPYQRYKASESLLNIEAYSPGMKVSASVVKDYLHAKRVVSELRRTKSLDELLKKFTKEEALAIHNGI